METYYCQNWAEECGDSPCQIKSFGADMAHCIADGMEVEWDLTDPEVTS